MVVTQYLLGAFTDLLSSWDINKNINKSIISAKLAITNKKFNGLVIAGDFNYANINWCSLGGSCKGKGTDSSLKFLDAINSCFLIQHVLEPTFGENILDLVMSEEPSRIFTINQNPPIGSSEKNRLHNTLSWSFLLKNGFITSGASIPKHNFNLGDYNSFCDSLNKNIMEYDFRKNDVV